MSFVRSLRSPLAIAALVVGLLVALTPAASAAPQACDDKKGVRVCVTYINGGYEGSAYNRNGGDRVTGLLTVTDQKTWKAPKNVVLRPGIVEVTRKDGVPPGHACAGLYIEGGYFPTFTACVN